MIEKLKKILIVLAAWLWANPVAILAIIIFIAVIVVAGMIKSCNADRKAKKDKQNAEQILKDKGKIEILENRQEELNRNAQNANENSRRSEANFNAVIGSNSSAYNGNFGAVNRRFCDEFPDDDGC